MRAFHKSFTLVSTSHTMRTVSEQLQNHKKNKIQAINQLQSFSDYNTVKEFDINLWDYYPILVVSQQYFKSQEFSRNWASYAKSQFIYVWQYEQLHEVESEINEEVVLIITDYFSSRPALLLPDESLSDAAQDQEFTLHFTSEAVYHQYQHGANPSKLHGLAN